MNARRMFDTLIHKHGVNLKPRMEINEIHTLLHLVKTGRWVAILVDSIIHGEDGLCAVPLREAALPMPVVWLYPKGMYMRKAPIPSRYGHPFAGIVGFLQVFFPMLVTPLALGLF